MVEYSPMVSLNIGGTVRSLQISMDGQDAQPQSGAKTHWKGIFRKTNGTLTSSHSLLCHAWLKRADWIVRRRNCRDQNIDNEANRYMDDEYYASKDYRMEDIEVPLLSVANWATVGLHLRGNVLGYIFSGSKAKFLRFGIGRHDLPFYYPESIELQKSFMDAFLKGIDKDGWTNGGQPAVKLLSRTCESGPAAEARYPCRDEDEWPLARTNYVKYYLTPDGRLDPMAPPMDKSALTYLGHGSGQKESILKFQTAPFKQETEITGHIVAHLNLSVDADSEKAPLPPKQDIDVFVTLRLISPEGDEVFFTAGGEFKVPLSKGWLRVSLRKVDETHPRHRPWLPHRGYRSTDVQPVINKEVYSVDVEIWPTSVIVAKGGSLEFELSSGDTQGSGIVTHNNETDRYANPGLTVAFYNH